MRFLRRRLWLTLPIALGVFIVFGVYTLLRPASVVSLEMATAGVNKNVLDDVLSARKADIAAPGEVPYGDDGEINILALGIDSRKEGQEQHCDAIHMVTLNVRNWTVKITSVPRGTYSPLPKGRTYLSTDYYVANACGFGGLDYGVAQIEKIVGVKADYVATVGFSEALGIFRTMGLPTTETLQFLRHRRSYQIGDPQRSHNQALFIKDNALQLIDGKGISPTMLHVMYHMINTDLDFDSVKALYDGYRASGLAQHPERITLEMRPYYDVTDMHFDPEHAAEQIDALLAPIRGVTSKEDLSDRPLVETQAVLVAYLRDALDSPEEVERIIEAQSWRQVEDEQTRESYQYAFTEKYVTNLMGKNDASRAKAKEVLITYILEKQFMKVKDYEDQGRALFTMLFPNTKVE